MTFIQHVIFSQKLLLFLVFRTLPANVTAEFVFDTFRLVPLLYSTFTADEAEKEDLQILQTVLDFNNITIESLFQIVSI